MKGLSAAAAFLTRVRLPAEETTPSEVGASVPWFPVVGAFVGVAVAGVYAAGLLILPPFVAASLAIGAGIALTGAFHEDGLGDTADALAGGWGKEDALRILKDPALGTFGVLAIVLTILVRAGALASLDVRTAIAVLPTAHALSRAGSVALLAILPAATGGGLGSSYAASVTRPRVAAAVGIALALGAGASGLWVVPSAVLAGLGAAAVGRWAARKIDGVTGDILGAAQQVGEALVLVLGAAFVTNGWPSPAWWR